MGNHFNKKSNIKWLNLNAPWTVSFNSPLSSSTSPLSPLLSLRKPTPLSSHTSSVNPSNTLGTVLSEPVLGLDMPPPAYYFGLEFGYGDIMCEVFGYIAIAVGVLSQFT